MGLIQTALTLVYPARCVGCGALVDSDFGLCGACWGETRFVGGTVCDTCGTPLPGAATIDREMCDDCIVIARPWQRGRTAMLYVDKGRSLVLALKHGDRQEIARPAGLWLAQAGRELLCQDTLIAPIPLHWRRRVKRRYNQSSLLAQALARHTGHAICPDLLERPVATPSLDGRSRDERFAVMRAALRVNPRRRHRIAGGRPVLLVDDVMTSGATLAAGTEACSAAGAGDVCILTLARVVKDT